MRPADDGDVAQPGAQGDDAWLAGREGPENPEECRCGQTSEADQQERRLDRQAGLMDGQIEKDRPPPMPAIWKAAKRMNQKARSASVMRSERAMGAAI